MKICTFVLEETLNLEFDQQQQIFQTIQFLWAMGGDIISKIYAGTASVMTSVTLKGRENVVDKIDHGFTSFKRFIKQNLSDDFKQECFLVI